MSDDLRIYPDEQRGHIAYRSEHGDMAAVDEGEHLHIGGGWLRLTPDQARRVAESLHWWADRHPEPEPEQLDGQQELDLGGLL